MSQEVASAKAVGSAVSGLTSNVSLKSLIDDLRGAASSGAKKGQKIRKEQEKAKGKVKKPNGGLPSSSEDKVTGSGPDRPDRVNYPYVQKSLTSPKKAISGPSKKSGPKPITPPAPTAKEKASKKASSAKKGTKNKSSIKIAEPQVDLSSPKGGIVYSITDAPRQFKNNGNK